MSDTVSNYGRRFMSILAEWRKSEFSRTDLLDQGTIYFAIFTGMKTSASSYKAAVGNVNRD